MHLFLAVKTTKCIVYPHYYCSSIGKIPPFEFNFHIRTRCLFQCFVCIHFLFGKKKTYFINPIGETLGKNITFSESHILMCFVHICYHYFFKLKAAKMATFCNIFSICLISCGLLSFSATTALCTIGQGVLRWLQCGNLTA